MGDLEDKMDVSAALEAGMALGETKWIDPETAGRIPYAIIPKGATFLNLEALTGQAPSRKKGTVVFDRAESFWTYIKGHKTAQTLLFVKNDDTGASFRAVFDHHGATTAGWREHVALFTPRPTPEWNAWRQNNGKEMSQRDFALFLEDRVADIKEPSGSEMLEIALTLEANTQVNFVSGVRLQNGNQSLKYEEVTTAGAGAKSEIEIPQSFKIAIRLFYGEAAYEVGARLRYRIHERQLKLKYELINPHLCVEDAVNLIASKISTKSEVTTLFGWDTA
jgi:uncharacterized protein YfdQ (DUF2303 family)